jgi:hypothetical protein
MDHQRMYRVIVVSGLGLAMPTLPAACGSGGAGGSSDASTIDGFPQEGPPLAADANADAVRADAAVDGFPQEGPPPPPDATIDGFPQEGPPPLPDSGGGG